MTTAKEKKLNETRLTWFLMGILMGMGSCSMVYYQYLQENISGGFAISLGVALFYTWVALFSWIAGLVGYKHGLHIFSLKYRLFILLVELNCVVVLTIISHRYFEYGYSFWAAVINAGVLIPTSIFLVYSFNKKANHEEERLRRILHPWDDPDEE